MRTIYQVILGLTLAITVTPAVHGRFGFEGHGLYGFQFDGETASSVDLDVEDRMGGGGSFFFSFIPAVRVEVGADYIRTRARDLGDSDLRIAPLTAALRAGYNLGDLYLYLGGGLGYTLGKLYPSREAEETYADRGLYDLDLSNDPIYFALAGAEWAFSERFGVRVEYRYNRLRMDLTSQDWRGFEQKEEVNLDHHQVRAGLAVYF